MLDSNVQLETDGFRHVFVTRCRRQRHQPPTLLPKAVSPSASHLPMNYNVEESEMNQQIR